MLETPFGKIKIYADGIDVSYEVKSFDYIKPPVIDKPIAGCYRIHIPVGNSSCIECLLDLEDATDYEGIDDVRVWFAADPTVYFKM